MKLKTTAILAAALLSTQVCAATMSSDGQGNTAKNAATNAMLKTERDRLSYTIGVDIGENLQAQSMDISPDILARGIKDATGGKALLMSKDAMQKTLQSFQEKMVAQQKRQIKEQSDKNSQQGEAFLSKNKGKKDVVTLDSGLQYKVLEKGKGASPKKDDFVTVEYEGRLLNGQVFDSTYKRGKPINFQVSQVITGWQEALQKMKPGSTWELYIPSNLAYGDRGLGGPIGPNETLIFKVHLISVGKDDKKSG